MLCYLQNIIVADLLLYWISIALIPSTIGLVAFFLIHRHNNKRHFKNIEEQFNEKLQQLALQNENQSTAFKQGIQKLINELNQRLTVHENRNIKILSQLEELQHILQNPDDDIETETENTSNKD
ncbi:MAG: hypothetical protein PF694_09565 [Bacteroidetes bacterium]|jgi:H2-forming N5,N10-methylenetetrahydromethanopterin dehydrogenase-like enzyme|nr:hypothetical protein [Bacteroidota bacterium]